MPRRTTVIFTLLAIAALLMMVVLTITATRTPEAQIQPKSPAANTEVTAEVAGSVPPRAQDASPGAVARSDAGPRATNEPLATYPDEVSLMARLRELAATDPQLSLKLAREGNARYPDSPEAEERSWYIAKSLSALGRFAEAQEVARAMVAKDPNSAWSRDVARHLLAVPPN